MKLVLEVEVRAAASHAVVLTPEDVDRLGPALRRGGSSSVLMVPEQHLARGDGQITVDTTGLVVLNRGDTNVAVIVTQPDSEMDMQDQAQAGDQGFLDALPPSLRELGSLLLSGVRSQTPGNLDGPLGVRRWVDRPDNFWTVRIQPRDESLAITVRGNPDRYAQHTALDVRPDQNGYSRFKVKTKDDVREALSLLRQVPRRH